MEVLTSHQQILPIIEKWPLMGTSAPIVLIFLSYLCFVIKIGPKYMEARKPFNLTNFTRFYNIFQVVACSGFVRYAYVNLNFKLSDTWSCIPFVTNVNVWLMYKNVYWWFLMLRLIEFCETVVFVLRKKQNQISILHIYHHISTAFIVWLMLKYNPCKFKLVFVKLLNIENYNFHLQI
jgi:GNS1/SUR4 family